MYQNNKINLSNTEISQLQKTHYKSPCNWIKSSVSSMTSAGVTSSILELLVAAKQGGTDEWTDTLTDNATS